MYVRTYMYACTHVSTYVCKYVNRYRHIEGQCVCLDRYSSCVSASHSYGCLLL